MQSANPWLIARNQRVETALQSASERLDLGPFLDLLATLQNPWQAQVRGMPSEAAPSEPEYMASYQTYCGT